MTPIEKLRSIAASTALDGVADAIREVADELERGTTVTVKVQGGDAHTVQAEFMGGDVGYLVCVPRDWQYAAELERSSLSIKQATGVE